MTFVYELFIILLMLVFNAVFAAYEMALASIPRIRLTVLVEQKKSGAEDALFMKDKIEASLAVVQLGITFFGAIAAAAGGIGAVQELGPLISGQLHLSLIVSEILALILIIIPLSCLTIIFAELVPKAFALNNKELVCLTLSPFIKILWKFFYPVVSFFERIVKAVSSLGSKRPSGPAKTGEGHGLYELRAAASVARTLKLIGAREEKIVLSITELSNRPVSDITIPASEISMIPAHFSLSDALLRAHLDMHTRFPVCIEDNNAQTITSYVNFKDIVVALHVNPSNPTLEGIARPIKRINSNVKIFSVFEEMISEAAHIALVRDEQERVLGMITLEDLLEELVGEIKDEYDRLPNYVHPYFDGWLMGGGVPMNIVESTTNLSKLFVLNPLGRVPTLAEWCLRQKGSVLKGADVIEKDALSVTVRKLRRNQLAEAIVKIKS